MYMAVSLPLISSMTVVSYLSKYEDTKKLLTAYIRKSDAVLNIAYDLTITHARPYCKIVDSDVNSESNKRSPFIKCSFR